MITKLNNSDSVDTQLITQSLLAVVVAEYIEICLIQSPPFLLALICENLSLLTKQHHENKQYRDIKCYKYKVLSHLKSNLFILETFICVYVSSPLPNRGTTREIRYSS